MTQPNVLLSPPTGDDFRPAAAYIAASERDPRRFPFGYLAGDPETGAAGVYLWFASPEELGDFLCSTEVALLQFDDDKAACIAASLRKALGGTRDLARLDLATLSAPFAGWCEIRWIGAFADLLERGGTFAKERRAEFRARTGGTGHAAPIADDEVDAFVAFLGAPVDGAKD